MPKSKEVRISTTHCLSFHDDEFTTTRVSTFRSISAPPRGSEVAKQNEDLPVSYIQAQETKYIQAR